MVGDREAKNALMMRLCSLFVAACISAAIVACDAPVTPTVASEPTRAVATPATALPTPNADAAMLVHVLDAMQVETHWLSGIGVD